MTTLFPIKSIKGSNNPSNNFTIFVFSPFLELVDEDKRITEIWFELVWIAMSQITTTQICYSFLGFFEFENLNWVQIWFQTINLVVFELLK